MYFQLVDNQVLSTQGQPDVFNLHPPYHEGELAVRGGIAHEAVERRRGVLARLKVQLRQERDERPDELHLGVEVHYVGSMGHGVQWDMGTDYQSHSTGTSHNVQVHYHR